MLERTLYGIVLENPKHRMLHVSPALQQAKRDLIDLKLLDPQGSLTNEGLVAQQIIKQASPRRAAYRQVGAFWTPISRARRYSLTTGHVKAIIESALETLRDSGLIEVDPNYTHGKAWRWRP